MAKILSIRFYFLKSLQTAQQWDRLFLVWLPETQSSWHVLKGHNGSLLLPSKKKKGKGKGICKCQNYIQCSQMHTGQPKGGRTKARADSHVPHFEMCSLSGMAGVLGKPFEITHSALLPFSFLFLLSQCGEVFSLPACLFICLWISWAQKLSFLIFPSLQREDKGRKEKENTILMDIIL